MQYVVLNLITKFNGEIVQQSNTSAMIFPVAALIVELSRGTTLLPGTVILTGAPTGVGVARTPPRLLRDGDETEITIDGVGTIAQSCDLRMTNTRLSSANQSSLLIARSDERALAALSLLLVAVHRALAVIKLLIGEHDLRLADLNDVAIAEDDFGIDAMTVDLHTVRAGMSSR